MRRFRSRGGSVKVNCILSEPPRYEGVSAEDAGRLLAHELRPLPVARLPRASVAGRGPGPAGRGPVRGGGGAEQRGPVADRRRRHRDDDVHAVRPLPRGGLAGGRARGLRRALPRHRGGARAQRRGMRWCTTRCSPRPTWSASSGWWTARSSRASRASTRWPSCAPLRCWPSTRRPVDGLYLCGAGTHPGGGVMAACGHNAAHRVLKDRRSLRRRISARQLAELAVPA